jgi:hypothetical protein
MAAPTKPFTSIADTRIDADSPLTEDLMEDYRDNDIHLEEWLGGSYTAAIDHDHDGVNSAPIVLAEEAVTGLNIDRSSFSVMHECIEDGEGAFVQVGSAPTLLDESGGVLRLADTQYQATAQKIFDLASGTVTAIFRVRSASDNSGVSCGLTDTQAIAGSANAVFFTYDAIADNIRVTTRAASTDTDTTTDADYTGSMQELKIVATSSQVLFYVDDVLKATHTTNIPSAVMYGSFGRASGTQNADYDYGFFHQSAR